MVPDQYQQRNQKILENQSETIENNNRLTLGIFNNPINNSLSIPVNNVLGKNSEQSSFNKNNKIYNSVFDLSAPKDFIQNAQTNIKLNLSPSRVKKNYQCQKQKDFILQDVDKKQIKNGKKPQLKQLYLQEKDGDDEKNKKDQDNIQNKKQENDDLNENNEEEQEQEQEEEQEEKQEQEQEQEQEQVEEVEQEDDQDQDDGQVDDKADDQDDDQDNDQDNGQDDDDQDDDQVDDQKS
ncbi:hypothetical protein IMG5_098480 [Ichthyophthirius multifiliis]|uniref:Uncharacterized protein n=1 Tax=Ichthyophthirius multifiliis TaxID=5932 RepID=G0QRY2_ICHMU|nr:hypothetical protein IMG5_098480 [Ichthyophthirius multifiliis]EGR32012.1 hypothetical protein IMG5_098480 [Ichthyophthirius multifiliis]|eukprot:XP_004035498.1 hypothetical protein IMG5_098480 [Ichthyophthirius multifiliis]